MSRRIFFLTGARPCAPTVAYFPKRPNWFAATQTTKPRAMLGEQLGEASLGLVIFRVPDHMAVAGFAEFADHGFQGLAGPLGFRS